jgi:hypothetical protein
MNYDAVASIVALAAEVPLGDTAFMAAEFFLRSKGFAL